MVETAVFFSINEEENVLINLFTVGIVSFINIKQKLYFLNVRMFCFVISIGEN